MVVATGTLLIGFVSLVAIPPSSLGTKFVVTQERSPAASQPPATQPQPRGGRMIDVPQAISDEEWESYCNLMHLSEGQRAYCQPDLDRYREEYKHIQATWTAKVRELGYADVDAQNRGAEFAIAANAAFRDALRAMREHLAEADRQFLEGVRAKLADVQVPAFQRVVSQRTRDCRTREFNRFGLATIDLVDLVRASMGELPLTREAVAILEEYDATITPMMVQLERERERIMPLASRLSIMMRHASPGDEARALSEERRTHLSRLARREGRIADLNQIYFDRVCGTLPPEVVARCRDTVDRIAYGPILPDTARPDALMANIRGDSNLSQDTVDTIDAIWSAYDVSSKSLLSRIRDARLDWTASFAATLSSRGYAEHREEMRPLLNQLCDLQARTVDQILATLGPEIASKHTREVDSWRAALANRRTLINDTKFPPP